MFEFLFVKLFVPDDVELCGGHLTLTPTDEHLSYSPLATDFPSIEIMFLLSSELY